MNAVKGGTEWSHALHKVVCRQPDPRVQDNDETLETEYDDGK